MFAEGQRVVLAGLGRAGKVLVSLGSGTHVQWDDGTVDLVETATLLHAHSTLDGILSESLEAALPDPRRTLEDEGVEGVVASLSANGAMAGAAEIAQEAVEAIAGALRRVPAVAALLRDVGDDDGAIVAEATLSLVREALGIEEED